MSEKVNGITLKEIATLMGISIKTLYRWIDNYNEVPRTNVQGTLGQMSKVNGETTLLTFEQLRALLSLHNKERIADLLLDNYNLVMQMENSNSLTVQQDNKIMEAMAMMMREVQDLKSTVKLLPPPVNTQDLVSLSASTEVKTLQSMIKHNINFIKYSHYGKTIWSDLYAKFNERNPEINIYRYRDITKKGDLINVIYDIDVLKELLYIADEMLKDELIRVQNLAKKNLVEINKIWNDSATPIATPTPIKKIKKLPPKEAN